MVHDILRPFTEVEVALLFKYRTSKSLVLIQRKALCQDKELLSGD